MCVQNLNFVALPVPEIIGGTKNWAVRGYAHAPFSPKILKGFCLDGPCEYIPAKFEVRSYTRSWDNRGYSKNLGSSWIRPRSIFSQIFKRLLFRWTLWIYLPNLKFIALPNLKFIALSVPEPGVLKKFGQSLDTPTLHFLPNFNRLLFAWTL